MRIRKRLLIRKMNQNKWLILNFLLMALVLCSLLARINGEAEPAAATVNEYLPIESVSTEEGVYAVTVELTGTENKKDVQLLSGVLEGLKVKATFFVDSDWLTENRDLADSIMADGHSFGLLVSGDASKKTRSEIMRYIAVENDTFYKNCLYYPRYVRINGSDVGKIPEVLYAYCQEYISASVVITSDGYSELSKGDIVCITDINSDVAYVAAELVGDAVYGELFAVSLAELLKT